MKTVKSAALFKKYRDNLEDKMVELYRDVLEHGGKTQHSLYIWSDGEIRTLEDVQGGNSYLQVADWEERTLHFVTVIDSPFFDPWDYADHAAPEDDEEKEAEEQEIIDMLVDEYADNVSNYLDDIIREAQDEGKYGF